MSVAGEVRGRALARAALLGNPSDGFGGKTIAVTFAERAAEVCVEPAGRGRLEVSDPDAAPLIEATVARFRREAGMAGALDPLRIALRTEIPREVGLGGSSAIVIATLRALFRGRGLEVSPDRLADLALAVEVEDLGIAAGPQDRLVQAHEGLLYMDFDPRASRRCERLATTLLPPIFVAYRRDGSAPSGGVHGDLRERFDSGDPGVRSELAAIGELASAGRRCLLDGDWDGLGRLMLENVAARARLIELDPRDLRLVELAGELGAPANYAGSGGAIVGLVPDGRRAALVDAFAAEACETVFPA